MLAARLIGGAGTGKTTELVDIVMKLVDRGLDPMQIGYFSFTRAARQEAAKRVATAAGITQDEIERGGWFRTLHALAYRCLALPSGCLLAEGKDTREWFADRMGLGGGVESIDPEEQPFRECPWESSLAYEAMSLTLWDVARNRLTTLEEEWRRASRVSDKTPPWKTCRDFIALYEDRKLLDGRVDFTDLLSRFSGWKFHVDEGPYQVRPEGDVPHLPALIHDEAQDASALSMAAFDRLCSEGGVQFCYLAGDPYQCQPAGTMVRTNCGYVPIERLDPEAMTVTGFDKAARNFEHGLSFQRATRIVDSGEIRMIVTEGGDKHFCTNNHKWFARVEHGECLTVPASYLAIGDALPKLVGGMEMSFRWERIKACYSLPPGTPTPVYSLNVEKHHTYIADGYVTCNSIYSWAGSDSKYFTNFKVEKERVTPKSHRCAKPILELGERILQLLGKGYYDRGIAPAEHDGCVVDKWETFLDGEAINSPTEEWLILTRTNRQAQQLAAKLNARGFPWRPTRGRGGFDAPARMAAFVGLKQLEEGGPINGEEWRRVCDMVPTKALNEDVLYLERGTKKRFDDTAERAKYSWVLVDELGELGATEHFIKLIKRGAWPDAMKDHKDQAQAVRTFGTAICSEPKLRLGTIHSAKGQEADNVLLLASSTGAISRACSNDSSGAAFGEEVRVAYVGATRARYKLVILKESKSPLRIPLP